MYSRVIGYTPREVAEFLGVSPRTVGQWLKRGRLKGERLNWNNRWRVHPDELRRYLGMSPGDELRVERFRRKPRRCRTEASRHADHRHAEG